MIPASHDAVLVERFVDAHDREAAFEGLGREQAIKRIAMMIEGTALSMSGA